MQSILFTDKQSKLSDEIELIRGKMVSLAVRYGFLHPEVQQCSKQLDKLLIQFYSISEENHKRTSALEESRV